MEQVSSAALTRRLVERLRKRELALFCGAGISMAPPSALPNWRMLADGIIRAVGQAAGETPRLADMAEGSRPFLDHLLKSELRPDVVMETLYDVMQEQSLAALDVLDVTTPNVNHLLIAHLAAAGYVNCVVTTNFDCLIETACQARGVIVHTVVTPEEYAADAGPGQGLTLYKLHGSIEQRPTLIASIDGIARGLDERKKTVMQQLLARHHLLFLGYSGNDFAINADYLLLEQMQPGARGITWNLRPGETNTIVTGLLDHYGDKGELLNADLPALFYECCAGLELPAPDAPGSATTERPPLEVTLAAWGKNLPQIQACFGLGRLYLAAANWDGALESIKIFYRKVREQQQGTLRELGLASYYLGHAYERFKAFNEFDTDAVFDIFLLLNQARVTFTDLNDRLMVARTKHTEARYVAKQNLQKAWSLYQEALADYEAAGEIEGQGEALVDMGDLLSTGDARHARTAMDCLQKGYELAASVGDLRQMVRALSALGYVLLWENRPDESRWNLAQATRWARILGDRAMMQLVLQRYGGTLTATRELEEARTVLTESVAIAESMGAVAPLFRTMIALATVEEELGDLQAAGKHYALVGILAPQFKRAIAANNAELGAARVLFKQGELQAAKKHALEALFTIEDRRWPNYRQALGLLRNVTAAIVRAREEVDGDRRTTDAG
jgi:tetratricopeptide (TPR) repeat protein